MESEAKLATLVAACIHVRDHSDIDVRDEALHSVCQSLERMVQERLPDERLYEDLDGLHTLSVTSDGTATLRICGAFSMLVTLAGGRSGHRLVPMDADLPVEPGAFSSVKVAGPSSVFDVTDSARQFMRAMEQTESQHVLDLRLA